MAISNTYAQKSYVMVEVSSDAYSVSLDGNVPTDMEMYYKQKEKDGNQILMKVVNMLAERGYEVEFIMGHNNSVILMSKRSSGSYNPVRSIKLNDDEDVTEVARYNLQGLPVKEHDKGVQIIVYSNYTTKTVIVQ